VKIIVEDHGSRPTNVPSPMSIRRRRTRSCCSGHPATQYNLRAGRKVRNTTGWEQPRGLLGGSVLRQTASARAIRDPGCAGGKGAIEDDSVTPDSNPRSRASASHSEFISPRRTALTRLSICQTRFLLSTRRLAVAGKGTQAQPKRSSFCYPQPGFRRTRSTACADAHRASSRVRNGCR